MFQKKKTEKIFVLTMTIIVIFAFFYFQNPDSIFSLFVEQFSVVKWNEINERYIVKNSIPIILLENNDGKCKVLAQRFDYIIDHEYFIRYSELAQELNYDRENETLILPCDMLKGEKSKLNVWYVKEESPKYATKFQYFVTHWTESSG